MTTIHRWLSRIDKDTEEERNSAVLNLYLQCYTLDEIAAAVGCTRDFANDVCCRIGNYEIGNIPGQFTEDQPEDSAAEKVKREWESARRVRIVEAMLEFHPIANIFPLLSDTDLAALAADIKSHGQRDTVLLFDGKVLDGRNRCRACELAGVKPRTKEFKGTTKEALEFVWSTNFHRRHLTSGQSAAAVVKREEIDSDFAAEVVNKLKEEAQSRKKAAGASGCEGGRGKKKTLGKQICQGKRRALRTDTIIAKAHGTNATTLAKARKIRDASHELLDAVLSGEKSITQAERELTKQAISKKLDWPEGKYRVIYADPPWSYGNTQPDYHTEQRDHYPVMPLKDICAMPVKDIALDDAVLFLWVTSPILGELIAEGRESGRLADPKNGRPEKGAHREYLTLDELGIERNTASRAQRIASIDKDRIREYLAKAISDGEEVSKKGGPGDMLREHPSRPNKGLLV